MNVAGRRSRRSIPMSKRLTRTLLRKKRVRSKQFLPHGITSKLARQATAKHFFIGSPAPGGPTPGPRVWRNSSPPVREASVCGNQSGPTTEATSCLPRSEPFIGRARSQASGSGRGRADMYFGSAPERAFERKNEGAIPASSVLLPPPPESGENGSRPPALERTGGSACWALISRYRPIGNRPPTSPDKRYSLAR